MSQKEGNHLPLGEQGAIPQLQILIGRGIWSPSALSFYLAVLLAVLEIKSVK